MPLGLAEAFPRPQTMGLVTLHLASHSLQAVGLAWLQNQRVWKGSLESTSCLLTSGLSYSPPPHHPLNKCGNWLTTTSSKHCPCMRGPALLHQDAFCFFIQHPALPSLFQLQVQERKVQDLGRPLPPLPGTLPGLRKRGEVRLLADPATSPAHLMLVVPRNL